MKQWITLLLIGCLSAACQTAHVAPHSSGFQSLEQDEQRIWDRVIEEEFMLDNSGFIFSDAALEAYLQQVLDSLAPVTAAGPVQFQVRVLKNPTLNAFAFPNGVIYIHTGMLARLENEAQLATLLAHEMTHATHRHSLKQYRNLKNQTALLATVQAGLLSLGSVGAMAGSLGSIGMMASVQGYSRDLEREADNEGFKAMQKAGYDPREAPKLFHHLQAWVAENEIDEPFFFGSHPRLQERIDNFTALIKKAEPLEGPNQKNKEQYMTQVLPIILLNASLDLDAGRYQSAKKGVTAYQRYRQDNPKSFCLLGNVYAEEKKDGHAANAMKYYRQALSIDPAYGEALRGIGMIEYKSGNCSSAIPAFQQYLALQPDASDRHYIQYYLTQCED